MMLRVSLRPWAPRRPLRVWPARVTRKPAPARPSADSTHSALRDASPTWACTQPEKGESLKTSLPATRSGSAGPRSGRSSSTPSKVSRPRSRSPSIAAAKPSSRSSGTSIIRALAPRTVSIAVRHRASSGATSTSSATKGSSSTPIPLARATSARSSSIRAGTRPARLSSDARSRRSSAWRWLSGNWSRSTASRSRRIRSCSRWKPASHCWACICSTANDSLDSSAASTSGAWASVASMSGSSRPCRTSRRPSRSSRTTCSCSSDSASDWSVDPPAARCDSLAASRSAR